jgi:hypothetical protein
LPNEKGSYYLFGRRGVGNPPSSTIRRADRRGHRKQHLAGSGQEPGQPPGPLWKSMLPDSPARDAPYSRQHELLSAATLKIFHLAQRVYSPVRTSAGSHRVSSRRMDDRQPRERTSSAVTGSRCSTLPRTFLPFFSLPEPTWLVLRKQPTTHTHRYTLSRPSVDRFLYAKVRVPPVDRHRPGRKSYAAGRPEPDRGRPRRVSNCVALLVDGHDFGVGGPPCTH